MMQTTIMEMQALEKGQRGGMVQFKMARGITSTSTVLWEASLSVVEMW